MDNYNNLNVLNYLMNEYHTHNTYPVNHHKMDKNICLESHIYQPFLIYHNH